MISTTTRQKIEEKLDTIIELAQRAIDETGIAEKEGKTQFKNLVNLTCATDSIKSIEVFILYQMGKERGKKEEALFWTHQDFGSRLINDIFDHLERLAEQIEPHNKKVLLEIVRLYLGYADRYYVGQRAFFEMEEKEEG